MNNEIELGIGCVLYILYIVGVNPHLVTLYKSITNGVIKRGMEWPE